MTTPGSGRFQTALDVRGGRTRPRLNTDGCRNLRRFGRGRRLRRLQPAATTTAAGSGLARPGFVDRQATAVVFLFIEGVDCRPCFVVGTHLDEPEALAPACVAVGDDLRALDMCRTAKTVVPGRNCSPGK